MLALIAVQCRMQIRNTRRHQQNMIALIAVQYCKQYVTGGGINSTCLLSFCSLLHRVVTRGMAAPMCAMQIVSSFEEAPRKGNFPRTSPAQHQLWVSVPYFHLQNIDD